jgi:hypothetical protein
MKTASATSAPTTAVKRATAAPQPPSAAPTAASAAVAVLVGEAPLIPKASRGYEARARGDSAGEVVWEDDLKTLLNVLGESQEGSVIPWLRPSGRRCSGASAG